LRTSPEARLVVGLGFGQQIVDSLNGQRDLIVDDQLDGREVEDILVGQREAEVIEEGVRAVACANSWKLLSGAEVEEGSLECLEGGSVQKECVGSRVDDGGDVLQPGNADVYSIELNVCHLDFIKVATANIRSVLNTTHVKVRINTAQCDNTGFGISLGGVKANAENVLLQLTSVIQSLEGSLGANGRRIAETNHTINYIKLLEVSSLSCNRSKNTLSAEATQSNNIREYGTANRARLGGICKITCLIAVEECALARCTFVAPRF